MFFFSHRSVFVFVFAYTAIFLSNVSFAETRHALVIGNGEYLTSKLSSPLLDVNAMEKKLSQLNYKVVARKNLTRDQLHKEISKFGALLNKTGSTGFFYYSGHGMQVNGTNYIIPIDLEVATEHDIEVHGVRVDSVISRMNTGKSNPNIIVLDACRNNPFEKSFKNGSSGLAEMKHTPPGMLIAFAAAPGQVARQSPNQLSPYTAELLNQLNRANLSLIPLFQAVQNRVWKSTGGEQEPRIEISPNLRDIVLHDNNASLPDSHTATNFPNRKSEDAGESREYSESQEFERARRRAEQGYADAQYYLAMMYLEGRGEPRNDTKAVHWFGKAAEQGFAAAQHNLGVLHSEGRGVPRNDAEAVEWYRKAAEQKYPDAQYSLGLMHAEGRGVPKDDVKGVEWMRKSAEQGYAAAQAGLGWMIAEGRGLPKDDVKGAEWIRKSAVQGFADGQAKLGMMIVEGRGMPKDDVKGVEWIRKGAEQGHAGAQTALGLMLAEGRGVSRDDVKAVEWYHKAAEQGFAAAQYNLGLMFAKGVGVSRDEFKAVYWIRKAAEQGFADAQRAMNAMKLSY